MRLQTAPGAYDPIISDFDSAKIKIIKQKKFKSQSGWAQNIAFDATESRFFSMDKSHLMPAPGQYSPKLGIVDNMPRKNERAGAFGTKSTVRSKSACIYSFYCLFYYIYLFILL